MEAFSRVLYRTLDHLGYNDSIIKLRRETWKYISETSVSVGRRGIIAGSKAEGITSIFESDIDLILFTDDILCTNNVEQLPSQLPHDALVFLADMENVPPGYTRLKLYRPSSHRNVLDKVMHECLFESESGEVYLSSALLTSLFKFVVEDETCLCGDVTGPALPSRFEGSPLDFDLVPGFTFKCPSLLHQWSSQQRQHEWPSRETIQKACSFLPQVVPVGAKSSERQFQEWRFCFIESELTLTHSLNGTQLKLYILLKMIAKNILKKVTSEISSYIMKNVTYWLSELLPLSVFREENLVSLVLLALTFLRTAISRWQNLPYYMIPSRNLIAERFDAHTRTELSDELSRLIKEGPRMFLRVDKLRKSLKAAFFTPGYIVKYGVIRDQVEKYVLTLLVLDDLKQHDEQEKESMALNIISSLRRLVVPHMSSPDPVRQGHFSEDEIDQEIVSILK